MSRNKARVEISYVICSLKKKTVKKGRKSDKLPLQVNNARKVMRVEVGRLHTPHLNTCLCHFHRICGSVR